MAKQQDVKQEDKAPASEATPLDSKTADMFARLEEMQASLEAREQELIVQQESLRNEDLQRKIEWQEQMNAVIAKQEMIDRAAREAEAKSPSADQEILRMANILRTAVQPGVTLIPGIPVRGDIIKVKRGDVVAYDAVRQGPPLGGWVKADEDTVCGPMMPIIGIALHDFSYDSVRGAPYHSVKFQKWKRFFKERGSVVVGKRELPDAPSPEAGYVVY